MSSSFLNLGIVAHVDAGKTSLTERLLFETGVIDAPGSVDAGTTRTDSLDLERRRGITIRAAVTTFAVGTTEINLVDTPGHPDFIAEVERSLGILDAAVLVLSSVEGVQPQTVVIWRALQRLEVPTLLFINKVDRSGSDVDNVIEHVRRRLTPRLAILASVAGEGSAAAKVDRLPLTDPDLVEAVAETDDRVLARWMEGIPARESHVRQALHRAVRTGSLTPVLVGSAITGVGVADLRHALVDLLPAAGPARSGAGEAGLSGTVFAVDRDARGRRAWVRMWDGDLQVRDRVALAEQATARPVTEPVTEVSVSRPGGLVPGVATAGQIAVVRGLSTARVGDVIGEATPARPVHRFAPATMQALIAPVDPAQRTALFKALTELADEDPLIGLRIDEIAGEAAVSLHGEVQKEVIAALLEERFGVLAQFSETSVLCLERVVGTGSALEQINVAGNPYLATIGLRIEARPVGRGVEWSPGIERGNLPPAFIAATEEGVRSALRHGLTGWDVTDCLVTMTASGYYPRQSHEHQKFDKAMSSVAADFRNLAPVVLHAALAEAGTVVCRPVDEVVLDLPTSALSTVLALLGRLGAITLDTTPGSYYTRVVAHLLSALVPDLARQLPDLTGGEAVLTSALDHHAPVPTGTPAPTRSRTGPDPGERGTWFRDVSR